MTTFQGILFAIVEGLTTFFPVDTTAHHHLLAVWLQAPLPSGGFLGILTLAVGLTLLFYLRHDFASLISGTLRVLLTWKLPMTIDERMPFFLVLAAVPVLVGFHWIKTFVDPLREQPLAGALGGVLIALLLVISNRISRKNKRFVDWTWKDALSVGVFFPLALVPGGNHFSLLLIIALFRNFARDGAIKFAFLLMTPLFLGRSLTLLQGVSFSGRYPIEGINWLTLGSSFFVCIFCSFLAIDYMWKIAQKSASQIGVGGFVFYRFLIVAAIVATWWLKTLN